jgi:hypothetical protein
MDISSAVDDTHQGVEDDDKNVMCLGGRVTGYSLSWELVQTFLSAHFKGAERFRRRLAKIPGLGKNCQSMSSFRFIPFNHSVQRNIGAIMPFTKQCRHELHQFFIL